MKVFCTRPIAPEGIDLIRQTGHEVIVWEKEAYISQEELIQICQNADALIVADRSKIDAHFLRSCAHLKVIALHFIGYDRIDIEEVHKLHIPISNTPGGGSKETADTAFMLLLAASKNAFGMYRKLIDSEYIQFGPLYNLGQSLRGKTLGIFGLGNIGMEMARLCKAAYHMNIIYHNRHHNEKAEKLYAAEPVSFENLLKMSDVISVHAALTQETKNKFDKVAFAQMKPSAIFINTARGAIHNEPDLIEALQKGAIWGAGLDVSNHEPMKADNPLLSMQNVAVTPHIGSAIDTARVQMSIMVANNIIAGLKGNPLPNQIGG